jgi:hypothetical protein
LDVADALVERWGKPDRYARFETEPNLVEVLKYDAETTKEGVVIYATATSGPSPSGHFTEFILGLDTAHDDVADPLARLAAFARSTAVHDGDTVPIDRPLWAGSEFRRFLTMHQVESIIGPFDIDGRHVQFMNAIPIYEAEVAIKGALGGRRFLDELRRQGIGFWDAARPALSGDIAAR